MGHQPPLNSMGPRKRDDRTKHLMARNMTQVFGRTVMGGSGEPPVEPVKRRDRKGAEATDAKRTASAIVFVGRRWPGMLRLFG